MCRFLRAFSIALFVSGLIGRVVLADSTSVRVIVTPPSLGVTNYPVRVHLTTFPGNATKSVTVYASDSTTMLYWCDSLINGRDAYIIVSGDFDTSPDTMYITGESNPSYHKCDSVFILYDDFDEIFDLSMPWTDPANWTATLKDTGAVPFFQTSLTAPYDTTFREQGPVMDDSTEIELDKRYKWFYVSEYPHPAPNAYYYNVCQLLTAPSRSGTWTKRGIVRTNLGDSLRIEDPDFVRIGDKWLMVAEDHTSPTSSSDYAVGLWTADSLDGVWTFYDRIIEPIGIGTPTNWLAGEPASPAFVWNRTGDTLACYFEAFKGLEGPESFLGLMVSYGDSIGYHWHFTDTLGVNDSNPLPIAGWPSVTGRRDSAKVIPDGAFCGPSGYWVVSHTYDGQILHRGDGLYNLDYVEIDEKWYWISPFSFDRETGFGMAAMERSGRTKADMVMAVDFDSTRWANDNWHIYHRAASNLTYRLLGSMTRQRDGYLEMYPSQSMTGSVTIASKVRFPQGYVATLKLSETSFEPANESFLNISWGDTLIQTYTGATSQNSTWWDTGPRWGYNMCLHPTALRTYRYPPGGTRIHFGGGATVATDTLNTQHVWRLFYTTGDSLKLTIDGVPYQRFTNITSLQDSVGHLVISQGEREGFNRGGVLHLDYVTVEKFTTGYAAAVAHDSLYVTDSHEGDSLEVPLITIAMVGDSLHLLWEPIRGATVYDVYRSTVPNIWPDAPVETTQAHYVFVASEEVEFFGVVAKRD